MEYSLSLSSKSFSIKALWVGIYYGNNFAPEWYPLPHKRHIILEIVYVYIPEPSDSLEPCYVTAVNSF